VRVGILAIQGDVDAHARALDRLGASSRPVLREKDLGEIDALILPGGESTTIAKGLDRLGLYGPLASFADSGKPILGTCAGAILLAEASENHPVKTLGLIDVVAQRNAYGTQVDSFAAIADPPASGAGKAAQELEGLRCVFIRAPQLSNIGAGVEILLRVEGVPALVRQGNILACTFHPELGADSRVHRLLDPEA
jgi:pyridoxal 5'-phosphate synthase pdxT subunit